MSDLRNQVERLREHLAIQSPLIGLDFPPSVDYAPRWGFSKPRHPILANMIDATSERFAKSLREIAGYAEWFKKIDMEFNSEKSDAPGWINNQLTPIDAAGIYWAVASRAPKTYLEIGSGLSTLFADAARKDHGLPTRIVSIDPQPRASVDKICDRVIRCGLEEADLAILDELEAGDVVFMDGTHRCFTNSDVTVFCLDFLPFLKADVWVGVHDIHWPNDYGPGFLDWYWSEQYILGAYLIGARDKIEVVFSTRVIGDIPEYRETLDPILKDWPGEPNRWTMGGELWFTHRSR